MSLVEACEKGDIKKVKKIIKESINIGDALLSACINGHLEIVKWLFEIGNNNDNYYLDNGFACACENGHLEIVEWVLEINPKNKFDIDYDRGFGYACGHGHLEIAKCLLELVDIHIEDEFAFCSACENGHLEIAKWLFEISETTLNAEKKLGIIDIHNDGEHIFLLTCINGHLEIAKWLIEITEQKKLICGGAIDIHAKGEQAFRWTCNSHLHIAKWLLTLYTNKELKNLNRKLAKEELENRTKNNLCMIYSVLSKGSKIIDMNAIAIIWKEYI